MSILALAKGKNVQPFVSASEIVIQALPANTRFTCVVVLLLHAGEQIALRRDRVRRATTRSQGLELTSKRPDVRIASDEILATQGTATAEELPAVDRRFVRRLKYVDKLSAHQKRILLATIDAFLANVS